MAAKTKKRTEERRTRKPVEEPHGEKKKTGGQKKILGLKPWQLGLVAVAFIVTLYIIWKHGQSTASTTAATTPTTTPTATTSTLPPTSGAVSGQPVTNYPVVPPATPGTTLTAPAARATTPIVSTPEIVGAGTPGNLVGAGTPGNLTPVPSGPSSSPATPAAQAARTKSMRKLHSG